MKRFAGKVDKGKLIVFAQLAYQSHIESFEGERVDVSVVKHRDKRTTDQNSYYWWILEYIEKETGHSRLELHEIFKQNFLPEVDGNYKEMSAFGLNGHTELTTTNKDTKEFSDYIQKIRTFMLNSIGLYIPEANEKDYIY